jgi:hypothetical protein
MKATEEMREWLKNLPQKERAKRMFLIKKSLRQKIKEENIVKMNKLIVKIILSIAIGVLVGTVSGNLESNKTITYSMRSVAGSFEISKKKYDEYNKRGAYVNKKVAFNKELGFYYGAITGSSLIILFLIPGLIKKQDD